MNFIQNMSAGVVYTTERTCVCMISHTSTGVEIPMTAKYYHRLRVFITIPYFRLTVNF